MRNEGRQGISEKKILPLFPSFLFDIKEISKIIALGTFKMRI